MERLSASDPATASERAHGSCLCLESFSLSTVREVPIPARTLATIKHYFRFRLEE